MTKSRISAAAVLLALVSMTATEAALPQNVKGEAVTSLAPLVEDVSPAVVNIRVIQTVRRRGSRGGDQEITSAGSGVIVDAERGYILTNHHVVGDADTIQISLIDGTLLDAQLVGSDPATDIAVIKVDADGLTEMPIGDSTAARVGDFVIAIGNPFGLGHTVTSGIISALGRTGFSRDGYEDFIQTDASINLGNSGGALVNMKGELIGINSVLISRSGGNVGIGFAVPTEIAGSIMDQILEFGEVRRRCIDCLDIDAQQSAAAAALGNDTTRGALITRIQPESAAEDAGLRVGDIIIEINNKKVDGAARLRNRIGLLRSGDTIHIKYVRDDRTLSTTAELGSVASRFLSGKEIHRGLSGSVFSIGSSTDYGGIVIDEVQEDSPAARRGLRAGDLITHVNRVRVRSLDDLRQTASLNSILFLSIRRGNWALIIQIR